MRANLTRHALNAFETYNPEMGTALRTHVNNRLIRVDRFNRDNQNLAFIPEEKSRMIGPIDNATGQLTELLGRAPSTQEIAAHLSASNKRPVTPKMVMDVQALRRADLMGSAFQSDPSHFGADPHEQVLKLLPETLKGDELSVFNYLYGRDGHPLTTSTGEIARRMGKSPSQISRIRGRVEGKYKSGIK